MFASLCSSQKGLKVSVLIDVWRRGAHVKWYLGDHVVLGIELWAPALQIVSSFSLFLQGEGRDGQEVLEAWVAGMQYNVN